jgi:energy-coupling factor transport system permease protein
MNRLYELNPAVKLVVFLSVIQMVSTSDRLLPVGLFFLFTGGLIYGYGLDIAQILSRLKPFVPIFIFTFIINIIFAGGVELSASLTFKFLLIVLLSIILTLTTQVEALAAVILFPFKGKHGQNLKIVFTVALRFIPILIQESKNIINQLKQSAQYHQNKFKLLFQPERFISPLISDVVKRSEEVAEDVETGKYNIAPVTKPKNWEILLAAAFVIMAVKYAV